VWEKKIRKDQRKRSKRNGEDLAGKEGIGIKERVKGGRVINVAGWHVNIK
jgi:hypothetical protein